MEIYDLPREKKYDKNDLQKDIYLDLKCKASNSVAFGDDYD